MGGNINDLFIDQFIVGASTSTFTANYNYIESTSEYVGKLDDCFTDTNNSSGVHEYYLYLNHYIFTSMSTSNDLVNSLLSLSRFSDPDKDPTYNKILSTYVIVKSEKKIKGKG